MLKLKVLKVFNILVFSFWFLVFGFCVSASSDIYFYSKNNTIKVGENLKLDFYLNTSEKLNAFEGEVVFSTNYFSLKEVQDANSIINLWIQKPNLVNNKIKFLGTTPGGFQGEKGFLFSIILKSNKTGETFIKTENIKFLLHDGLGTEVKISNIQKNINIIEKKETQTQQNEEKKNQDILEPNEEDVIEIEDYDKPEDFEPVLYFDKNIEGGKYILIFNTQDKGSGLDHYEIQEGDMEFINVNSPYILKNQNIDKDITIKAVDKEGNIRLKIVKALEQKIEINKPDVLKILKFSQKEKIFIASSLLFMIFVFILILKKKKVKSHKNEKEDPNILNN